MKLKQESFFKSRKLLVASDAIPTPHAKVIFAKTPFINYEQLLLDKSFRQHFETIMVSKKILWIGAQKIPIQKTYEMKVGIDSINIDFLGANRQFDWIELSPVYEKNDRHTTIYDSDNIALAAKTIKSVKLSNFTDIWSLTNGKEYDIDSLTQIYLLHKQFVAWSLYCLKCRALNRFINNPIYQELIDGDECFETKSDEKIYLDLRASSGYTNKAEKLERNNSKINLSNLLKAAATKKLRLRV